MHTKNKPAGGGIPTAGSGLSSPAKHSTVVPIGTPFAERHRVIEAALYYATWNYTHGQHGRARWFLAQARRAREARHG